MTRQRAWPYALLFVTCGVAHAQGLHEVVASPDSTWQLVTTCEHASSECTVYAEKGDGSSKQWIVKDPFSKQPGVKWLAPDLAEVVISCGSPCNASIFFSPQRGVSELYDTVVAVNTAKQVIASAAWEDSERGTIVVVPLFGPQRKLAVVARKFSPVAALRSAIVEARFIPSGALKLRYLVGDKYDQKEEIIPIRYPIQGRTKRSSRRHELR